VTTLVNSSWKWPCSNGAAETRPVIEIEGAVVSAAASALVRERPNQEAERRVLGLLGLASVRSGFHQLGPWNVAPLDVASSMKNCCSI
jgi:hypothetical protein